MKAASRRQDVDPTEDATPDFSSRICSDMFASSQDSRTDSCALAFCGVLLWQRNRFWFSQLVASQGLADHSKSYAPMLIWLVTASITGLLWYKKPGYDDDPDTTGFDSSNRILFLRISIPILAVTLAWKIHSYPVSYTHLTLPTKA